MERGPLPGASAQLDGGRRCIPRTTTRRRPRAVLASGLALAAISPGCCRRRPPAPTPANAAEASRAGAGGRPGADRHRRAGARGRDHRRRAAGRGGHAAAAGAAAQAALAVYEPQLRAIAQSGYTGKSQSRVAAFLTSDSADELVQQMTTLDMIAHHTNGVVAEVAAPRPSPPRRRPTPTPLPRPPRPASTSSRPSRPRSEEGRRVPGRLRPADGRRAGDRHRRPRRPRLRAPSVGSPPPPRAARPPIAVADRARPGRRPLRLGRLRPGRLRLLGPDVLRLRAAGVALPHSSRAQSALGVEVARADLQPGDLVFFYSPISHVGLYIGNGMMVHARTFGQPVAVTSVDQRGYRFAKRIV